MCLFYESPDFPLCVLKTQDLTEVRGFAEENMFTFSPKETFATDPSFQVKKAIVHLNLSTTFRVWHAVWMTHWYLSNENSLWEVPKQPCGQTTQEWGGDFGPKSSPYKCYAEENRVRQQYLKCIRVWIEWKCISLYSSRGKCELRIYASLSTRNKRAFFIRLVQETFWMCTCERVELKVFPHDIVLAEILFTTNMGGLWTSGGVAGQADTTQRFALRKSPIGLPVKTDVEEETAVWLF